LVRILNNTMCCIFSGTLRLNLEPFGVGKTSDLR